MDKFKQILKNKYFKLVAVAIMVILILVLIISFAISSSHNKKCRSLKNEIIEVVDKYVADKDILPTLNGTSITINIEDLSQNFTFKKNNVTGTITYTKYNDTMIKTFDIKNADYCSTKKFGKETDKYNEKNNNKVAVYFNYKTVESFNSKWSSWMESELISKDKTMGVNLPINSKKLPAIPNGAIITEYVKEDETYYSYRDKKWKWYKNNIKYSDYSSEKPNGYANKDVATLSHTESTEWSLDYPEVKAYRHISTKTGYQWYKTEKKEKIYWENGKYSFESPGDEYKKDKDKSAKMYSYYDDTWRWYNGSTKRIYSSLSSTKPYSYNYKDETTLTYNGWSSFKNVSYVTKDNKNYREEKTDIYSRYLIKYEIHSYSILDKPVTQKELEEKLGKSYSELLKDKSLNIEVIFKFQKEA